MSLTEFELIQRYFNQAHSLRHDVVLGIGDDAAIVSPPIGKELVISVDTLHVGVHFEQHWSPADIGYRALAVNLSDIAAMAAEPAWVTLALSLPEVDEHWLAAFGQGFFTLADEYEVQLIGGDLVHGPLSMTVQIHGIVEQGMALRRDAAQPGDIIYLTNHIGAAGLALLSLHTKKRLAAADHTAIMRHLFRPTPRIKLARALASSSHAAIDISDGLLADLSHVLRASDVGASITVECLPICPVVHQYLPQDAAYELALTAGDDYELCITAPVTKQAIVEGIGQRLHCPMTAIGKIEKQPGLRCLRNDGTPFKVTKTGYLHFQ